MGDPTRGLYEKFVVKRTDGKSEPGGKHEHCHYFVLDLDHDPHAKAALKAYAKSCRKQYPLLARDLRNMMKPAGPSCGCRSAGHELGCLALHQSGYRPAFGKK
jgi:hypothetical protein